MLVYAAKPGQVVHTPTAAITANGDALFRFMAFCSAEKGGWGLLTLEKSWLADAHMFSHAVFLTL